MSRIASLNRIPSTGRKAIDQANNNIRLSCQYTDWGNRYGNTVIDNSVENPFSSDLTASSIEWTDGTLGGHLTQTVMHTQRAKPGMLMNYSVWLKGVSFTSVSLNMRGTASNAPLIARRLELTPEWKRYDYSLRTRYDDINYYVTYDTRPFVGITPSAGIMHSFGSQVVQGDAPLPFTYTLNNQVWSTNQRGNNQGQNLIVSSENFTGSEWVRQSGVSVTPNATANPLTGEVDAQEIDVTSAGVNTGIYQNLNGLRRELLYSPSTMSIWLKGVAGGEEVSLADSQLTAEVSTFTLTTEWQRFSMTAQAHRGRMQGGLWFRKVSGNKFYAWGAQMTRGTKLKPYVKTTKDPVGMYSRV
jgi:hypothetical protein